MTAGPGAAGTPVASEAASGTGLGVTLRAWRDRLPPGATGLPVRHGRRAAGLRREELVELAGLSVDHVVRLEQGRATTPSAQVVDHPLVGPVSVDGDTLADGESDLTIVVLTAVPGSDDESRLRLAAVAGEVPAHG